MTRTADALVIGAGLAGAAVAAALARHGWHVLVLARSGPAGSSVPVAVMAPPPLPGNDTLTRLRRRGAWITRAWIERLEARGLESGLLGRGVTLVPVRERQLRRWSAASGDEAAAGPLPDAALAGAALPAATRFRAGGLWVRPAALCDALLGAAMQPRIATVARLERRRGTWRALDGGGREIAAAAVAIVAAGPDSAALLPALAPALIPARGQATAVVPADGAATLRGAISGPGYIAPDGAGRIWLGATLEAGIGHRAPRDADDRRNLALYRELWPAAAEPRVVDRFVGVRATTRDRLPLAGPLGGGLWVSAGHGAQGLMSAPLCGLLLARAIRGGSHPLLRRLAPLRCRAGYGSASATATAGTGTGTGTAGMTPACGGART